MAISAVIAAAFYFIWKRKPQIRKFTAATFAVLATGLLIISFLDMTVRYGKKTFPLARVDEVIETLQMPISGFSAIFIHEWLWTALPVSLLFSLSTAWILKNFYRSSKHPKTFLFVLGLLPVIHSAHSFLDTVSLDGAKKYARFLFGEDEDFSLEHSDFLKKHFKFVDGGGARADSSTKNLVYIIMESMENSFERYISPLDSLAQSSLTFSPDTLSKLGGGFSTEGALNTVQSVIAKTSGIPVILYSHRTLGYVGKYGDSFFDGVESIYDVLHRFGYKNVYVQGTDSDFAKMRAFFLSHGIDVFYDNVRTSAGQNAKEAKRSDVTMQYKSKTMWHDGELFEKSRQILDTLSKHPHFSLTISTIDTHFPHGFHDENCQEKPKDDSDEEKLIAALKCSSRETAEFVKWIQAQPFGENTTIVITGDHIFQGEALVKGIPDDKRQWIDIFIHPAQWPKNRQRLLTSFDMAPTVLECLGFHLEDSGMGLGTSLFSDEPTLAEKFGLDSLNAQVKNLKRAYEYNDLIFGKRR